MCLLLYIQWKVNNRSLSNIMQDIVIFIETPVGNVEVIQTITVFVAKGRTSC